MSHAVLVCWRNKKTGERITPRPSAEQFLKEMSSHILPKDIDEKPPIVNEDSMMLSAVLNPKATVGFHRNCFFLGAIQKCDNWPEFGRNDIEGSYSIFRCSNDKVELVTDIVASRTIWYFFDDNMLIASSSQAIISYVLGSFEANEELLPWVLSNGTLGPGVFGWDRRVMRVEPDTIVTINRKTWSLDKKQTPVHFKGSRETTKAKKAVLKDAIGTTIQTLDLSPQDWTVLLSGGKDSRAIISFVKDAHEYNTICWGLAVHRNQYGTDASIAELLSKEFGTKHSFVDLGTSGVVPETTADAENSNFEFSPIWRW